MMGVTPSTAQLAATLLTDQAETLRHHISQVSLMHGWAPVTVQVITASVLACAIGWRSRRWRRIPLALVVGERRWRRMHTGLSGPWVWPAIRRREPSGIWLRNLGMRAMNLRPLGDLLVGQSFRDEFELPDYAM
jgi:hypothetical protein